jgi:DNA topoisomerase I
MPTTTTQGTEAVRQTPGALTRRTSRHKRLPAETRAIAPTDVARAASLRYVSDSTPGITRHRQASDFYYRDAHGKRITKVDERARIDGIGIPPAWTAVWISPQANGHIQATGRDARGRKQYRYHARWQSLRGEHKFGRMLAFGDALPTIRERVNIDMSRADHSREKVLAIVVRLLETTYIRIGNEEYATANGSFGLTTLRNKHVRVSGDSLRFDFVGKMGKAHSIRVTDRRLSRVVRRCRELPGQSLFQYRGDDGDTHAIDSTEVNEYIREIARGEFTAKDFRTWAGSLLAVSCLVSGDNSPGERKRDATPSLNKALKAVSAQLGNTPAVCKSGYIHPVILAAFTDVTLRAQWMVTLRKARARAGLTREEGAMLTFLAYSSDIGK